MCSRHFLGAFCFLRYFLGALLFYNVNRIEAKSSIIHGK